MSDMAQFEVTVDLVGGGRRVYVTEIEGMQQLPEVIGTRLLDRLFTSVNERLRAQEEIQAARSGRTVRVNGLVCVGGCVDLWVPYTDERTGVVGRYRADMVTNMSIRRVVEQPSVPRTPRRKR